MKQPKNNFVFRSDFIEDSDEFVPDTLVREYEFINQGNTVAIVNDFRLYPADAVNEGQRLLMSIYENENDVSQYKIKFEVPDFVFGIRTSAGGIQFADYIPFEAVKPVGWKKQNMLMIKQKMYAK